MERILATVINAMHNKARVVIMIAFMLYVITCCGGHSDKFVLSDFESEADLDRVKWQCHTLFSIADENATHGNSSLRLELYPSAYPGLAFALPIHNWSTYEMLSLDIFNPQNEPLSVSMRIDDKKDYPDYEDRYNRSFAIKPGMNHLRIPLSSMVTSGTVRSINLKNIHRCLIFMAQPDKKYVVYIDYVHLS